MADLTQEQVLAQLRTRGFETGGFRSPLRWFRGKMDTITGSMVQRGNMTQPRLEVLYNFSELEVFETTEPYPSPITQINIMHSTRDKSAMGVLGRSMDKLINVDVDENMPQAQTKNQDFLQGRVQEWKVTPGHMMWDADKGQETPRECWEVVYIEGIGGAPHSGVATVGAASQPVAAPISTGIAPAQQAMNLLDGKTQQEWNTAIFQDPLVRGDGALIQKIIGNQFIPDLEATGLITKDENGIYHVKKD